MAKIVDIRTDDWHWIYINDNVMYAEGTSELDAEYICDCINTYMNRNKCTIDKIKFETKFVDEGYAEYGMPRCLSYIPDDIFM